MMKTVICGEHEVLCKCEQIPTICTISTDFVFQIINEWSDNCVIVDHKCDLTTSEKSVITSDLAEDKSTLEISKINVKYHQTEKNVIVPIKIHKRAIWDQSRTFSQCFRS